MRNTQSSFFKKIQPSPFPRIRLPAKLDNFEWQKSLWALQGYFVITNENSPFEWVGSVGAYPCIINLIHATDDSGKKVAACTHLSREEPDSVKKILESMNAKNILSVAFFSGCTTSSDPYVQALFKAYEEMGVQKKSISFSLGQHATQAALNVKSGETTLHPIFFPENAGRTDIFECDGLNKYPGLILDGTNPSDVIKIETLARNLASEFETGKRSVNDLKLYGSTASFIKKIAVLDDDPQSRALKLRIKTTGMYL